MTTMTKCRIEAIADSIVAQGISSGEELEALTDALWDRVYGPAAPRRDPGDEAGITAIRARLARLCGEEAQEETLPEAA